MVNKRRARVSTVLALLVVMLSVSSCAPNSGNMALNQEATSQLGQPMAALNPAKMQPTQTLIAPADGDIGLEVMNGEGFTNLIIKTGTASPVFNVSQLASPARVVIDMSAPMSRLNRVLELRGSDVVSRIRVGAHPEKSRIVLDLPSGASIQQTSMLMSNGDIVVRLTNSEVSNQLSMAAMGMEAASNMMASNEGKDEENKKIEEPHAMPNMALNNEEHDEHKDEDKDAHSNATLKNDDSHDEHGDDSDKKDGHAQRVASDEHKDGDKNKEEPHAMPKSSLNNDEHSDDKDEHKEEHKAVKAQKAANLSEADKHDGESDEHKDAKALGLAMMQSLAIQPANDGGNQVVAELSRLSSYKLTRTATSEFVLQLDGARMGQGVGQTLIAPPKSGAIRSVRPVVQGNSLLLRIFTQPNQDLTVAKANNQLIVGASNMAMNLGEAMAQPKAEVVAPKVEGTEKAPAPTGTPAANAVDGQLSSAAAAILEEAPKYTGRLISLDLQDTDIDNALRIIAEVSNLNIITSGEVSGKVTLRLIDVPWDQALDVILKTNGLDKVQEGNVVRIAGVEKLKLERSALKEAMQAQEELEPLKVKYIRINYAKASDIKSLVESVISERGVVSYDERSNQLIVKDIQKGIVNVAELVSKLDLRTPQVLLETQIVEANRSLLRDLGSELGFSYIQSPETGNATGKNFPNRVNIGGTATAAPGSLTSFPAAIGASAGSAISALFGSADGSRTLNARISALETEGRARLISRPSVATLNNKQAIIKSIEKIRIKLPSGGTSVATGNNASAAGGTAATETVEIGIILEVTPQASPDYYVLLDINAKSSSLGSRTVDGIPSEIERSATSTVLVSSGQTFALGGIYKINDINTVNGVPFMKDLPVLGHLFSRNLVNNSDEELIFFITPRIVEGSFDDAAMKMVG